MPDGRHLWAIILAGGDGVRLRDVTRDAKGAYVPKQFYAFGGRDTMVRWAVNRAKRLVSHSRIVAVVAEQHRRWWMRQLSDLAPPNLLVQPLNRGTAAGLLLPLLEILRRDPFASIVVFPSDHYVAEEARLATTAIKAIESVCCDGNRVALLGIAPCDEDTEYGWIVPTGPSGSVQEVATFVEKPDRETARALMRRGALLNSLIVVGKGRTLLHLLTLSVPQLVGEFVSRRDKLTRRTELLELYQCLRPRDFSKEVLQTRHASLSVVRVPECGWTDLGTPDRMSAFRESQTRNVMAGRKGVAEWHDQARSPLQTAPAQPGR